MKVPHLCLVENPSMSLSKGNPNLKDVGFATRKPSLMMLKPKQEAQGP
jgi:hypothetical protein